MHESKTRSFGFSLSPVRCGRTALKQLAAAWFVTALVTASAQAQEAAPPAPVAPAPEVEAPPPAEFAPPPPPPVVQVPPQMIVITPVLPVPVIPPAAATPGWSPVYTGSFFTRYELRQGFDNAGIQPRPRFVDGDAVFYRARFGIGTGPIDVGNDLKVALQFTPQASGVMGSLANTTSDVNLGLHEGYLRAGGKFVRLDTGRFELDYGDSLVVGNLDWNETARTFDGMRARVSSSPTSAWIDVFATLVHDGRQLAVPVPKAGDGDQYFVGAYATLGPAIMAGLDLDVYLLGQVWGETEKRLAIAGSTSPVSYRRDGAGQVTFGARVKQRIKIFDYRLEAGLQGGTRSIDPAAPGAMAASAAVSPAVDVLAYQADLELGVTIISDKLRVSLEGIYASGDDPTTTDKNEGWDELFPTAHKFLGLADAFVLRGQKRTNVSSGVLHITASPIKPLTIQADGHVFARPEKIAAAAPALGMPGAPTNGYAGAEIDLGVSYLLAAGLKVRGLYGAFLPDSAFYPTASALLANKGKSPDPVHYLEVELRYDL